MLACRRYIWHSRQAHAQPSPSILCAHLSSWAWRSEMHPCIPCIPLMSFLVLSQINTGLSCTQRRVKQWCVLGQVDFSTYPLPFIYIIPDTGQKSTICRFHWQPRRAHRHPRLGQVLLNQHWCLTPILRDCQRPAPLFKSSFRSFPGIDMICLAATVLSTTVPVYLTQP